MFARIHKYYFSSSIFYYFYWRENMKTLNRSVRAAAWAGAGLVAASTLAACAVYSPPAQPVSATKPSITYAYRDDAGLIDATRKAETYCMTYNSWPRTTDIFSAPEGGRNVTFVCDQPRAATVASAVSPSVGIPAQPSVNYTYRDDRGLIEASNQAQRYCAGFTAHARSTLVTTNVDGSKTISFECVRMP